MSKPDPERLAAALRANLRKRKGQAQAVVPEPSFGSDEEGDVEVPLAGEERAGAWASEGSKKP